MDLAKLAERQGAKDAVQDLHRGYVSWLEKGRQVPL